jgi:tetratricopeptide (TPR) repeat protein
MKHATNKTNTAYTRHGMLFLLTVLLLQLPLREVKAQRLTVQQMWHMLDSLEFGQDDTIKVNMLYVIAFNYRDYDPDSGIVIGKAGNDLATRIGWEKGIAKARQSIAVNYMAKGEYAGALGYLYRAADINEEIGYRTGLLQNYINAGICFYNLSDFPSSLELYFRAMNIAEALKDSLHIAKCSNGLGNTFVSIDSTAAAERYFKLAIDINTGNKDAVSLARSYHNMGTVYEKMKKYRVARMWYFKALDLNTRQNILVEMIKNYGSIASTYRNVKKDIDSAIYYYFKALDLAQRYSMDPSLAAINFSNIASAYFDIYKDRAVISAIPSVIPRLPLSALEDYSKKAVTIFREYGNYDDLQQALETSARIKALSGKHESALVDLYECLSIKDSIFSITNKIRVQQLVADKIRHDEQRAKEAMAYRQLVTKLMIGTLVAVVLGIFLIIMRLSSASKIPDHFTKRFWTFTFLLISGLTSLLMEPTLSSWFEHNLWLLWIFYILIPLVLEQFNHLVLKKWINGLKSRKNTVNEA